MNAKVKLEHLRLQWRIQFQTLFQAGHWPERQFQLLQHIRTADKLLAHWTGQTDVSSCS